MDEIVTYNIDLTHDDEIDARLGLLVRSWATLEYHIIRMTGEFLSLSEKESRAALGSMNMRPRLEIATILAPTRLVYEKDREAFKKHKLAIEKAQETRNLLAHGLWGKTSNGDQVVLQIWGGKDGAQRITPKPHPMDAETLEGRLSDVIKVIVEFLSWRMSEPAMMPSPYRGDW